VQRLALPIIWIVTVVVFGIVEPTNFLTGHNFQTIFSFQAVTLIVTLGLIVPLTTADFDLSIAYCLGLSSMTVAVLNVNYHVSIGISVLVALAVGLLVGIINAAIVVKVGVNAFIATLGTGTVLAGATFAIGGGATVAGVSTGLVSFFNNRLGGLTFSFYLAIALSVALWYVLDYTPIGRRLLFIGRGPDVARLSGIRVSRMRIGALLVAAVMAALAGIVNVATVGAADPSSAASELLPAYAAAFLGATTISPGRFNVWGTVVTVYFLATGFAGLQLLGLASWIQQVFYGTALVVAVAVAETAARRRAGRSATRSTS
jgi:ribose transport system permease protein